MEGIYRQALAIVSQRLRDPSALGQEFQAVLKRDIQIAHSTSDSQLSENTSRNRYINVLPFDYNRLRLRSNELYVNASLCKCSVPLPQR